MPARSEIDTNSEHDSPPVNSDPIRLLQQLARTQRPRLAVPAQADAAAYRTWASQVREKAFELLGQAQMLPAPPLIAGFRRSVEDGLRRERFFLQTEPGYWAPVLVTLPAGDGPYAAVLCLHGHVTNGKDGVCGLLATTLPVDQAALLEEREHYNDTYGADLARRGYLTISLDNRDFNEAQKRDPYTANEYSWHLAEIAWQNAFGRSYVGCGVWDAQRALDYLVQRPDVDAERVGCIGFSLGGLLTMFLTLLDPRIRAAVIAGYFDSFLRRVALGAGADCLCNYIPDLYTWLDIPDVVAALAPRPVLVNLEGTTPNPYYAPVRQVYESLGAADRGELYQYPAPYHRFSGERAYPWLEQWVPLGRP